MIVFTFLSLGQDPVETPYAITILIGWLLPVGCTLIVFWIMQI